MIDEKKLKLRLRVWKHVCERTRQAHITDRRPEAAEYHRGAAEAYKRVLDELEEHNATPSNPERDLSR